MGLRQSDFGTAYAKPTRLLIKLDVDFEELIFSGAPVFDNDGYYLGPIPQDTSLKPAASLVKRKGDSAFRTTGTAAWAPLLCKSLVSSLNSSLEKWLSKQPISSEAGGWGDFDTAADVPGDSFPIHLPPDDHLKGGIGKCRSWRQGAVDKPYNDGGALPLQGAGTRSTAPSRVAPTGTPFART